ncbi:hypothetical protein HGO38_20450 [Rhizobium sp. CG5]|uniref:hypothetical protein n=1 Tax=Rhizobium sp. CG5 TaxID=2726076 RepID=UPI002033697F|nr:hypothetical protein [Rhizobium sp. CG5]MCM2475849.1 hypothetical protein [Rhizobium sp. CG5]
MRIDSSLSNAYYQNRFVYSGIESDENAAEAVTATRSRATGSVAVSSTLLSSSLANALWSIEGGKRAATAVPTTATTAKDDRLPASPSEQIEAFYLENMTADDE